MGVEVIQKKFTVEVLSPALVNVLFVGTQGPPGSSGAGFVHTQSATATEWIVNHNLGFNPAVEVINTGGVPGVADVLHMSINQVRIYFAVPTAGQARCV